MSKGKYTHFNGSYKQDKEELWKKIEITEKLRSKIDEWTQHLVKSNYPYDTLCWALAEFELIFEKGYKNYSEHELIKREKKIFNSSLDYDDICWFIALGMIRQALTISEPFLVLSFVIGGIVGFFLLEKLIIWRHCHNENCEVHGNAGPILLIGDGFHNLIDGMIIAASFLVNFQIGVTVSVSIIAHEIPQEVGDFAILLHGGYSKKRAFLLNLLSSITTIPGAIIAYFLLEIFSSIIPYIMAISAASFIYIALSDLTPELHHKLGFGTGVRQIILILAGIGTIVLILLLK